MVAIKGFNITLYLHCLSYDIAAEIIIAAGQMFLPDIVTMLIMFEYYVFYYGCTTLLGLDLLCDVPWSHSDTHHTW